MSEDERVDYGQVFGRSIKEKLVLAIIDAYPATDPLGRSSVRVRQDREQRLRNAMKALFADTGVGRPVDQVSNALWWMAYKHQQDNMKWGTRPKEVDKDRKPKSIRQLAEAAAERYRLPAGSSERLRKRFSRNKERLLHDVNYHDDVPEQIDYGMLTNITDLLKDAGIQTDLSKIDS